VPHMLGLKQLDGYFTDAQQEKKKIEMHQSNCMYLALMTTSFTVYLAHQPSRILELKRLFFEKIEHELDQFKISSSPIEKFE
jgi:hypothetical protein